MRGTGAIVGFLIGLCADEIIRVKIGRRRAVNAARVRDTAFFNETFMHSLIGMFVKLALVDGQLNNQERQAIDKLIKENFKNYRRIKPLVEESIRSAMNSNRTLNSYAIQFVELSENNKNQVRFAFAALLEVAMADSSITPAEKDALLLVAEVMGLKLRGNQGDNRSHYNGGNGKSGNNNNDDAAVDFVNNIELNPYSLLGCSAEDSNQKIKEHYVQLVQEYHPDKIYAKDLPEDFIKFANYKFDLIQNAYKQIKQERGIK